MFCSGVESRGVFYLPSCCRVSAHTPEALNLATNCSVVVGTGGRPRDDSSDGGRAYSRPAGVVTWGHEEVEGRGEGSQG